jgi:hypothetical protein
MAKRQGSGVAGLRSCKNGLAVLPSIKVIYELSRDEFGSATSRSDQAFVPISPPELLQFLTPVLVAPCVSRQTDY